MKRTKMIELLRNHMNDILPNDCSIYEAGRILDFIEDVGMFPPSYIRDSGCGCCSDIIEAWEEE